MDARRRPCQVSPACEQRHPDYPRQFPEVFAIATILAAPTVARRPTSWLAVRTCLIVLLANCAVLVLQLVAGRLLAPFIGVSLATWTSIIGVFMAGISLGNWHGGKVADRDPNARTLSRLLFLGGVASLAALGFILLLGDGALVRPLPLLPRIFLLTTVFFLPASYILSMITPLAIRLLLPDVRHTGSIVGTIYALGTLGSLVGNFLTGFVLIAYLPVNVIVIGVSAVLVLLGLFARTQNGQAVTRPAAFEAPAILAEPPVPDEPLAATSHLDAPRHWWSLAGNIPLACAVVAIASACTMTIELAASRVLAPHIGVSLYTWTGIIGVVLIAITIGNYLGGRLADRWPKPSVLGLCIFLGGLTSLATLALVEPVTASGLLTRMGLIERIVSLAALLFFVPVLFLSTISPQVTRLAVTNLAHAGRVAGHIYAWSTAGALVGTFATGWLLISLLGVYRLIFLAGLILLALTIVVGQFWRQAPALIVSAGVAAAALVGLQVTGKTTSACTMETDYFCIRVQDQMRDDQIVRALVLDHLIHSFVKVDDPSYLGYEHEHVQAEMTRAVADRVPDPHVLVIGGGGYTYPRWVEAFVPSATIEVVEVDPGVTEIAYRELGLSPDTRIVSHNLDGRQFVHEVAQRDRYDLVVQDAVNDLSVPYHIMTKEYNDYIAEILTDDGIYLLTVIDLYDNGQLLRSAIRTMMRTFPEVELLSTQPSWNHGGSSVFVIYGSKKKLDLNEVRQALERQGVGRMETIAQESERLRAYVESGPQIVLTDQYAPVDNLISILFRSRS